MKHVWIAQCLCPDRHCILAHADETNSGAELVSQLENTLRELLAAGILNPWCGICHAPSNRWTYAADRTRWSTMEKARPHLLASEASNIATGMVYGEISGPRSTTKH